ncbi:MAG: tol-pal system YbgF family protein, partial [Lachnospiraceae bacterium]
ENAKGDRKKREKVSDGVIKYQSGNETIIQPVGNRENRSLSVILNMGIGIAIGVAAACFLLLPARLNMANNAAQNELRAVSEQLDKKTGAIEDLEQQAKALSEENERLRTAVADYEGDDGAMVVIDGLLSAVQIYMEEPENTEKIAKALENVEPEEAEQIESAAFQNLYQLLLEKVGPSIASAYYESGMQSYRKELYEDAIRDFELAAKYDSANSDILYDLGNAYRKQGNNDRAAEIYKQVIESYPDTEKARRAQSYLDEINGNAG